MAIPVTLEDAKRQLKIDDSEQDVEVDGFIADAAAWVENYTGHILQARDVIETFSGFGAIQLRAWPIKSDAVPVVTYAVESDPTVSVTAVRIDVSTRPAKVLPWTGARWPAAPCHPNVTVTIRAGYEDAEVIPRNFRRAMLVLIGAYDADREGGEILAAAEKSARLLCSDYRLRRL